MKYHKVIFYSGKVAWKSLQLQRSLEYLYSENKDIELTNVVSWFGGTAEIPFSVREVRSVDRLHEKIRVECQSLSISNEADYTFHDYRACKEYTNWDSDLSSVGKRMVLSY